jgi:hypothetical protein
LIKSPDKIIEEIEELLEEASSTVHENISQAIILTEKALFKSQKIKQKGSVHANALNQLASIQRKNKELATAKGLATRAIDLSTNIEFKRGIADGKYNLAKILLSENKPSDALPYLIESSNAYKALDDKILFAKSICLLGQIYERFRDFKSAKERYKKALDLSISQSDHTLESSVYLYLANVSIETKKYSKARQYIEKSLQYKKEDTRKQVLAFAHYLKGKIYFHFKEAENALSSLDYSLELFKFQENKQGIVDTQIEIGKVFIALREFEQAKEYLNNAFELARNIGSKKALYNCHRLLSNLYKEIDVNQALEHLENYIQIKEEFDEKYIQNIVDSFEMMSQIEDQEKDVELEEAMTSIIQSKNTEMDSFFYRVSHDLKGPIASLLGLSELAKRDIKDKNALQYLGMYENQIKRLNMIVMELINITELNHREKQLSKINFYEIIDNCITAYTYLPNFDKIRFRIDISSDLNFSSEWYIVNTILQNLIENSIKYIDIEKPDQIVDILVSRERNNIIIELTDNGLGIPIEHQSRIFEMFFRASNNAEGTGLGLFILKRAVERLKGEVALSSENGSGTTFTITLPIQ